MDTCRLGKNKDLLRKPTEHQHTKFPTLFALSIPISSSFIKVKESKTYFLKKTEFEGWLKLKLYSDLFYIHHIIYYSHVNVIIYPWNQTKKKKLS